MTKDQFIKIVEKIFDNNFLHLDQQYDVDRIIEELYDTFRGYLNENK